ncbi:MAG: DedA family protein [Nocardioides sp.]|uniref:DedA family protein n=1 Tax=Nocardioides sp. TaxID=35761 RepID=UPI0039E424BB
MTALLTALIHDLGPAGVGLLALVVFAETGLLLGFFLPGDSLLFTAGILVASGAMPLPVVAVMAVTAGAAIAGDQVAYWIGRRWGRESFSGRSRWLPKRRADAAVSFFARHGHRAVVLARFLPLARTFTPVVAGGAGMPRGRFTTYNIAGGVLWACGLILSGYLLGGVQLVADHVELVALAFDACVLFGAAVAVARSILVRRRNRDRRIQIADDDAVHRQDEAA